MLPRRCDGNRKGLWGLTHGICSQPNCWERSTGKGLQSLFDALDEFNSKSLLAYRDLLTQPNSLNVIDKVYEESTLPQNVADIAKEIKQRSCKFLYGTCIYAIERCPRTSRTCLLSVLFDRIDADLKAFPVEQTVQVLVGDGIDRGPNSREVIDILIARKRQHSMVYLKGNHESLSR